MLKMKNISTLVIAGLFLAGCSQSDIEKKKVELAEAKEELATIKAKIATIEEEISDLDTTEKIDEGAAVKIAAIAKSTFEHSINVHGVVEASKNIMVNPEVAGKITSIKVSDGQKISRGQVIAIIDNSIIRNNIEEVKKGLEFATTIFEKQKALNEKGVGTEVQFLEAKNRKESLEKSLATLNSQLEKYVVKSPIAGYIEDVMPKVGEMASPQMPIAQLVNLEKVFVESEVSEALLGKVNKGDEVEVEFSNLNKVVSGKVIQTGQFIHPQNRTFKVKIDLNEKNDLFKPNLLSVVKITDYSAENAISVPTETVQEDLKGNFVFVNEGNKATKKYVEIGMSNDSFTEITSGLAESESLIIEGFRGLVQGEKLNLVM